MPFSFFRRRQPAQPATTPAVRVVLSDLTVCYRGFHYSMASVSGVVIGSKVAVHESVAGLTFLPLF